MNSDDEESAEGQAQPAVSGIEISKLIGQNYKSPEIPGLDDAVRVAMNSVAQNALKSIDLSSFFAAQLMPAFTQPLFDIDKIFEPLRQSVQSLLEFPKLELGLRQLVERRLPPNWSELEDWQQAAEFVDASGWPILWLPRVGVVEGLIAASEDDREAVLMASAPLIVEDATACASEIEHPHLEFIAECIIEIAQSIRDDRYRSAQALSASVLTELIQGILGHHELADARREFAEPWQEKSIRILRFSLITSAIPLALTRFYRQRGDVTPSTFNRHAVAHVANPIQFTPTNAVIGLIIATSLARELQELIEEGTMTVDEA